MLLFTFLQQIKRPRRGNNIIVAMNMLYVNGWPQEQRSITEKTPSSFSLLICKLQIAGKLYFSAVNVAINISLGLSQFLLAEKSSWYYQS